jgi:putative membrane protein
MSSAYRASDRRRATYRWRSFALASGLAVILVALASPLDALAHELFSAHMAQHMLLVACAAPLIALARPGATLARGAPRALARAAARAVRPLRRGRRRLAAPIWAAAVLALHVGAIWIWHAPPVYEVVLRQPAIHALSHAVLFATALLFWSCLVAAGRRGGVGYGAAIALAFGAAAGTGILGALLTFATTPLYPAHAGPAAEWGMTVLGDQQLGGLLMWVPGGTVYLVAALVLVVRLLDAAEPRATSPPRLTAAERGDPRFAPGRGDARSAPDREPGRVVGT